MACPNPEKRDSKLDSDVLYQGTVVEIEGIPFKLIGAAMVESAAGNFALAQRLRQEREQSCCTSRCTAAQQAGEGECCPPGDCAGKCDDAGTQDQLAEVLLGGASEEHRAKYADLVRYLTTTPAYQQLMAELNRYLATPPSHRPARYQARQQPRPGAEIRITAVGGNSSSLQFLQRVANDYAAVVARRQPRLPQVASFMVSPGLDGDGYAEMVWQQERQV